MSLVAPKITPVSYNEGDFHQKESPVDKIRNEFSKDSQKNDKSHPVDKINIHLTPQMVLEIYKHKLTNMEIDEILNYSEIYCIGLNAKKREGVPGAQNNNLYDNHIGSYIEVCHDHIAYRYEILKVIGKGSFGKVLKVWDHKTDSYVALKIVRHEKRFHKQAQEEIKILESLKKQDVDNKMNVVHILDHFNFRNHICISFELLSIDLYELLRRNKFRGLGLHLIRKIAFSILKCLRGLSKNSIIHCDLKPENVLLKHLGRSGVKVIDFGSSCFEYQCVYTYIQSRFYRAPEVILGIKYNLAIDIWSLGCILAELYTGTPLFPGEDEKDQLSCIMEVLGQPPQALLQKSKRAHHFFKLKGYPSYCTVSLGGDKYYLAGGMSRNGKYRDVPASKDLSKCLLNCKDEVFLNFLRGCLKWDPKQRLTPAKALQHPLFYKDYSKAHQIITSSEATSHKHLFSSVNSNETMPLNEQVMKKLNVTKINCN